MSPRLERSASRLTHILRRRDSFGIRLAGSSRGPGQWRGKWRRAFGARPFEGAFELGGDLVGPVEGGRGFGKKQETSAHGLNGVSHGFSFVGAKIVEDDNVVGFERRDEELFDVGEKSFAVDRTVEHAGRLDAVVAQRGEEGRGLPFALRDLIDEAFAARGPAVEPCHVGFGPGLVDEHQPRSVDALLAASPTRSVTRYLRTIPLARDERLFLSVTPRRRKKRLIIEVSALTPRSTSNRSQSDLSVMSDFSPLSASRNSRCGSSFGRRYPPILLAAREPLRSKRCTHLIADDSLTPNRAAAARRLIPPRITASITRSRKSWE